MDNSENEFKYELSSLDIIRLVCDALEDNKILLDTNNEGNNLILTIHFETEQEKQEKIDNTINQIEIELKELYEGGLNK
jgi:hypothetical protein